MKRLFWSVPLILGLTVGAAYAAFDGSHHDLRTYAGAGTAQGCFHCHGRIATATVDPTVSAGAGDIGTLCLYRCHALAGIYPGTEPGALQPQGPGYPQVGTNDGTWATQGADFNIVRFDQGGHGRALGTADTAGGGFPYAASGATTGNIECTSCHAVHDNKNAPFVWLPLIGEGANNGLCDACHAQYADLRSLAATVLPTGNHPVDFAIDNTASRTRTSNATVFRTARHGRAISIDGSTTYNTGTTYGPFDVVSPSGTALNDPATHWATGGKMARTDNTYQVFSSGASRMGCATCHSAHMTNPANSNISNQTVVAYQYVADGYNPICVGCHGDSATWAGNKADWNVGVSGNGHPAGSTAVNTGIATEYNTSVGGFTFNIAIPTGAQFGANGQPICSSCHYVHKHADGTGAVAGSMLIRNYTQGTTAVICKQCHTGVGFPNVNDLSKAGSGEGVNAHHRTTTQSITTPTSAYAPINEAGANMQVNTPTWAATAPLGLGVLSTGMDCADCHVFNGTAHNW